MPQAQPQSQPQPQLQPQAMIEVENLVKTYGATRAVDGISFRVERGEILGFLGPNGAGKTTTMRVLTGYTPPTSGAARLGGLDVRRDSLRTRALTGYLPENAPLYDNMKVREYLDFMAAIKRHPRRRRPEAIDDVVDECGLEPVLGRVIGNLSKGFRQRVGLAQALLGAPEILVLDEPTVGLDPRQIHEIRKTIEAMAGRRTVILSTHILPEVSMTCQKVVIINNGRIEAEGAPEHLVSRLGGAGRIALKVAGPPEAVGRALEGVAGVVAVTRQHAAGRDVRLWRVETETDADPSADLARAVVDGGWHLLEMHTEGRSLEDVFLRAISEAGEAA